MKRVICVLLPLAMLFGLLAVAPAASAEFTTTPMLSAGVSHTLVLKRDGTVWAFGDNNDGQLGDGAGGIATTPVQAQGLQNVIAVSAGRMFSLALKDDGTVWGFGNNQFGQLGDGTMEEDRWLPVQAKNLTGVIAISAGDMHSLALKSDGTVWAFGANNISQLGDNTTTDSATAIQVPGLSGVVAVSAGDQHSLALKSDGTVWAWGNNSLHQLGDGTDTTRRTPVQVSGISDVVAIAAGWGHNLATKSDGTVWAWGQNTRGCFGIRSHLLTKSVTPIKVDRLSGMAVVAAGSDYSLFLDADGIVWGCVDSPVGQIVYNTYEENPDDDLFRIRNLSDVVAIAAGDSHCVALKSDGTVWGWGDNRRGQLGIWSLNNPPGLRQVQFKYDEGIFNVNETNYTVTLDPNIDEEEAWSVNTVVAAGEAYNDDVEAGKTYDVIVTPEKTYSVLPTAQKDDETSSGWYTAPTGGKKINPTDTVKLSGNTKLYAHWDTGKYFKLWGKVTTWEKSPMNWILLILMFGWIWMAF